MRLTTAALLVLALGLPAAGHGQSPPDVYPNRLTLQWDRDTGEVELRGREIADISAVRVLDSRGILVNSIRTKLGRPGRGNRTLVLTTDRAREGEYTIEVVYGRTVLETRFTLRIEVPRLGGVSRPFGSSGSLGGSRTSGQESGTQTIGFMPIEIDIGTFAATIAPLEEPAPFEPVSLNIGSFQATIAPQAEPTPFEPVTLDIGTFQVTIQPVGGL